jgi:hypothetical protein
MMNPINRVPIVLQNEFALVQGNEVEDAIIKTSIVKQCIVFSLYNKETKMSVLAHLDDYADVRNAMNKINNSLVKFNTPLNGRTFCAKLLGGTNDEFSLSQKQAIRDIFRQLHLTFEELKLTENIKNRPQIALNARNGELIILDGNKINGKLEYLQQREYGMWNDILDDNYKGVAGHLLPSFEIHEANRCEEDLPKFEYQSIQHAQILEGAGFFSLPLQPKREVVKGKKEIITEIEELINQNGGQNSGLLLQTVTKRDFNLLLRQSSTDPVLINLLQYLLQHRFSLDIDLESRGNTSGTAMDVAFKYKNQKAIDLLKTYQ